MEGDPSTREQVPSTSHQRTSAGPVTVDGNGFYCSHCDAAYLRELAAVRRERIATAALQGLIAGIITAKLSPDADKVAQDCMTYADALIAALDAGTT